MKAVNIRDAKNQFSRLVTKAAAGEDVVICRRGKPLVRITRLPAARRRVRFGLLAGRFQIPADFDEPLPTEVLAGFERSGRCQR